MMALTQTNIIRETRRRLTWITPRSATDAFARAASLGAVGVLIGAFALPGATPVTIAMAIAVYTLAAALTGWFVQRRYPHRRLGLCNHVTLVRLVLVCALIAPLLAGSGPSWAFLGVALLALCLDGVDGWLARRQDLVSNFGARFDVEVDSLLALVLAVNAALNPQIGPAALVLGLPRYAFVAAGLVLPWMNVTLPDRFSRKVVCVLQLAALIALQAPNLPPGVAVVLAPVVAILLIWSFAVDIIWLWRSRA